MKKKLFPLFFLAMPISAMAYIGEDLMIPQALELCWRRFLELSSGAYQPSAVR